jgi:transposase
MFVPVVASSRRDDVAIEVEIDGAVVRIARTAKADLAAAVVQALRSAR